MQYDFNEIINRRGTGSVKADGVEVFWKRNDLTPLWVADMDFRTPQFVVDAVERRARSGVLGYTFAPDGWKASVQRWLKKRHNWSVEEEWIDNSVGVVPGMALALLCFTDPGDAVLIQPPVYHPFFEIVEKNGRVLRENPLLLDGDNFRIDFDDFEAKVQGCKAFLLCNPHNPGGRVWTKDELARVAEICARHLVLVISDEIHADMSHKPHRHVPFALASECAAQNSLTFCSATKSFNMPALALAYTVVPNEDLRRRLAQFMEALHLTFGNVTAFEAMMAAYTDEGREWLDQMLAYVEETLDFVQNFLAAEIPSIKMIRPQASFLVWLDCRALQLSQPKLCALFEDGAHLALNSGTTFGAEGAGFMRLNVASPRSVIEDALRRLKEAVEKRGGW